MHRPRSHRDCRIPGPIDRGGGSLASVVDVSKIERAGTESTQLKVLVAVQRGDGSAGPALEGIVADMSGGHHFASTPGGRMRPRCFATPGQRSRGTR